ncbi:1,4-dihydroxy-2-naphthoate octaprenyltransferase [Flavobacteriaceae bacterium]|nr:1,4-dihydroxy-2-naphthoate octaprenyltransferase [Flavobacteriaceae bacterium]
MLFQIREWILAARLRTIPLSISGIFIGSSAAYYKGMFDYTIFFLAIFTTISYQVLSNFANDYGDGVKGTDDNRIGPKRAVQSGKIGIKKMKKGIVLTASIALCLTFVLVINSFKQDLFNLLLFVLLGILAVVSAIKYTVGKNPYGYMGFGDFFVFIFFGLVSVLGSNFLYTSSFNVFLFYPACTIGLLSVGVLNLNNMRDLDNDLKSKKNTIAVKLGVAKSKIYHFLLILSSVIVILAFQLSLNSNSIFFNCLIGLNILWLLIHLIKIYNIQESEKFDVFLKPLALSTFFYSTSISLYFLKIIG